ncbi:uncharacterized protein LOC117155089 [Bombus vancouverensis nearcticus]|uniref:uncharacterized protein LOC117155089 n=1 Tax=Bombus vancouverensis nearcticus TaxID=2705178 RepID=UPI001439438A|nr:uncharacterized protein LOC117155089 [Bombus vancouverensis nearcticus]
MMHLKLIKNVLHLKSSKSFLENRQSFLQMCSTLQYSINSKKTDEDDDDYDKPYKYSTSKAATYPARHTIEGRSRPNYEGLIIGLSLAAFSIYFGILREENDIDEAMIKNIDPAIVEQIYGKQKEKYKA